MKMNHALFNVREKVRYRRERSNYRDVRRARKAIWRQAQLSMFKNQDNELLLAKRFPLCGKDGQ